MEETVSDVVDISFGAGEVALSGLVGAAIGGIPVVIVGIMAGLAYSYYTDGKEYERYGKKTFKQHIDSLF